MADIPYHNSQMKNILSQMNKQLCQLEQENNEMRPQNLQYQHQIEARTNEQTPSSSRLCTDVRSMPLLETPTETITNNQTNGERRTLIDNQADQNQEEQVILPMNTTRVSGDIVQPSAISVSLPSSTHEAELQR